LIRKVNSAVTYIHMLLMGRLRLKFTNRIAAGRILGDILKNEINKIQTNNGDKEVIVLGIPRGGFVTAGAVAKKLSARLGVVFSQRLVAPNNQELTIGAVSEDGELYLNQELIKDLEIPQDYLYNEKIRLMKEISAKLWEFEKSKNNFSFEITDKIVVLVDDGAASGATLMAAIGYLDKLRPRYFIIGIPVAPNRTVNLLANRVDNVKCIINAQDRSFRFVEQYYVNFSCNQKV
jgi:putative phosphoribosyl transferase